MKKLITIQGDVFHADTIAAIYSDESETQWLIKVALRGDRNRVCYYFDTRAAAISFQLEAVNAWREALA